MFSCVRLCWLWLSFALLLLPDGWLVRDCVVFAQGPQQPSTPTSQPASTRPNSDGERDQGSGDRLPPIEERFCLGQDITSSALLQQFRTCSVIVGHLNIVHLHLTCCDFTSLHGSNVVDCTRRQACKTNNVTLFPFLTDVTGFLRISDVHFPPFKDTLGQIFPRLTAVHGLDGFRYNIDSVSGRLGITAFVIELSNLQYLADYGPICIRNPGSIGRVGGFDVSLDDDDQNFFVDPADSSDTSSGLVLLVNNLRLCNAPPQGIHFPGGIFNPDKRTLVVNGEKACALPFGDLLSSAKADRVLFLGELYARTCPKMLSFQNDGTTDIISPSLAPIIENFCEYDCRTFTPPIRWTSNLAVPCIRRCAGNIVTSVSDLALLFGCTQIQGDMIISLNRPPSFTDNQAFVDSSIVGSLKINSTLMDYLELALGSIVIINGSFNLLATDCVRNLDTLTSLKVVTGNFNIANNRYLSRLGAVVTNNISVEGNINFHGNSALCPQEIARLEKVVSIGDRFHQSENGYRAHCVECLPTVSLVSTAVRVPDQNTLGFGFNFSFTPSMTPCDPAIAKIYPDLVASIAGIVPALHLWDVVIENVTNCDINDPTFALQLARSRVQSNNCTDDDERWFSHELSDGNPFREVTNTIRPCTCYAVETRHIYYLPDGRVLGLTRSGVSGSRTSLSGQLPAISGIKVVNRTSSSLEISFMLPKLSECTGPDVNATLDIRYTRSLDRESLYNTIGTDEVLCKSNQPDSVNFEWTGRGSNSIVTCMAWPRRRYKRAEERSPNATIQSIDYTTVVISEGVLTQVIKDLLPSTQYLVEVRYRVIGVESQWSPVPSHQTWTSDPQEVAELKPEPPSITFEPNIFTSGETVGLAWNALNNTGIHFYRVEVLTTCRSIFSDVAGLAEGLGETAISGRQFADELTAAGCVSCDAAPGPAVESYNCYTSCQAGKRCVLSDLEHLVCFCHRYRCKISVTACTLNGTCGPSSNEVPPFDFQQTCGNSSFNATSRGCVFTDPVKNPFCYYVNESCRLVSSQEGPSAPPTERSSSSDKYIPIVSASVVAIAVVFILLLIIINRRNQKTFDSKLNKLEIEFGADYDLIDYVPDKWEVEPHKVEVHDELGQGAFGQVFKGILYTEDENGEDIALEVAIKTSKTDEKTVKSVFLQEASVMKKFNSPHIVKLLGIVSQVSDNQETMVLMEYMPNRDLKTYLRGARKCAISECSRCVYATASSAARAEHTCSEAAGCEMSMAAVIRDTKLGNPCPTNEDILRWAYQIAHAICHMKEMRFVHRDLSARNCMLDADLNIKLADFGLTRDIYQSNYYRKMDRGALPIRWLPHEALDDGIYTPATDMWSYGVVLWEIATMARLPYGGMSNNDVINFVADEGGHLKLPAKLTIPFPDVLKAIMQLCFTYVDSLRPSAEKVIEYIEKGEPEEWMSFEEVVELPRESMATNHQDAADSGSSYAPSIGESPRERTQSCVTKTDKPHSRPVSSYVNIQPNSPAGSNVPSPVTRHHHKRHQPAQQLESPEDDSSCIVNRAAIRRALEERVADAVMTDDGRDGSAAYASSRDSGRESSPGSNGGLPTTTNGYGQLEQDNSPPAPTAASDNGQPPYPSSVDSGYGGALPSSREGTMRQQLSSRGLEDLSAIQDSDEEDEYSLVPFVTNSMLPGMMAHYEDLLAESQDMDKLATL